MTSQPANWPANLPTSIDVFARQLSVCVATANNKTPDTADCCGCRCRCCNTVNHYNKVIYTQQLPLSLTSFLSALNAVKTRQQQQANKKLFDRRLKSVRAALKCSWNFHFFLFSITTKPKPRQTTTIKASRSH